MSSSSQEIFKEILRTVAVQLRRLGYKGSGQNYRRATDKFVSVVNFQKSSGGSRFYVNVGVQPLFAPTEGEADPDAKKIKEYECIFRTRVAPPSDDLAGWPYGPDDGLDVAAALSDRIQDCFDAFVDPFMTIPGPVTTVTPADFGDPRRAHPLLGGHHARTFLHLARIAQAVGNAPNAREFANLALEICPERASSLRRPPPAIDPRLPMTSHEFPRRCSP